MSLACLRNLNLIAWNESVSTPITGMGAQSVRLVSQQCSFSYISILMFVEVVYLHVEYAEARVF